MSRMILQTTRRSAQCVAIHSEPPLDPSKLDVRNATDLQRSWWLAGNVIRLMRAVLHSECISHRHSSASRSQRCSSVFVHLYTDGEADENRSHSAHSCYQNMFLQLVRHDLLSLRSLDTCLVVDVLVGFRRQSRNILR